MSEEIEKLRERLRARERGDVIIKVGSRFYRLDRKILEAMPFGIGRVILLYVRIVELIQKLFQTRGDRVG